MEEGSKYNKLTAIGFSHKVQRYDKNGNKNGSRHFWLFKCECGNLITAPKEDVKNGHTKSCGCFLKEVLKRKKTHGDSESRLYVMWKGMIGRCKNKNNKNYGKRGISVCDNWRGAEGYLNFKKWSLENGYKEIVVNNRNVLTLDRIDNDKDYSPQNCRWVKQCTQNRNTRRNIILKIDGEEKCLYDWWLAIRPNISYKSLIGRYNRGWDLENLFKNK